MCGSGGRERPDGEGAGEEAGEEQEGEVERSEAAMVSRICDSVLKVAVVVQAVCVG